MISGLSIPTLHCRNQVRKDCTFCRIKCTENETAFVNSDVHGYRRNKLLVMNMIQFVIDLRHGELNHQLAASLILSKVFITSTCLTWDDYGNMIAVCGMKHQRGLATWSRVCRHWEQRILILSGYPEMAQDTKYHSIASLGRCIKFLVATGTQSIWQN